jgi:hypothetical protein
MPAPSSGRNAGLVQAALPCSTVGSPRIDRIMQDGANIDPAEAEQRRDLRNDLGFAHARWSQRKVAEGKAWQLSRRLRP